MHHDVVRQQKTITPITAAICLVSGLGFFAGIFIKDLIDVIGFFWLCFSFSMLLLTCIPWMLFFTERKKKKSKTVEDVLVFSQSSSKKSIIHSMRPESFAESILCDTEDEEEQEDESTLDISVKSINSKPVMVAP
ncbi:hypothetical protein EDC96DRAFT_549437 [Choanephora cucurbitarum]|nr:hypothetical protein EDC96DRAFT_549437 [Choanephora cucurbitarum]